MAGVAAGGEAGVQRTGQGELGQYLTVVRVDALAPGVIAQAL